MVAINFLEGTGIVTWLLIVYLFLMWITDILRDMWRKFRIWLKN